MSEPEMFLKYCMYVDANSEQLDLWLGICCVTLLRQYL